MGCCLISSEMLDPAWAQWSDHPARLRYSVVMDLGQGAFSQVTLCQSKANRSEYSALKVVFLKSPDIVDDPDHVAIMRREAEYLQMLRHPNIVEYKGVLEDEKQIVIITEWLRGGGLLDGLADMAGPEYSEQQCAAIFSQVAEALAFMHEQNIIHRDIKPENILFVHTPAQCKAHGTAPTVKLIDLGMAITYDKTQPIRGALGSPGFVAPEVIFHEVHTPSMDVYSLGVVLFIMLVGRKPYNVKDCENLEYCCIPIMEAPGLQDDRWKQLSCAAKELVLGMLQADPAQRLTIKQVCSSFWLRHSAQLAPKLLSADVTAGAANVASLRTMRNLSFCMRALQQRPGMEAAGFKGSSSAHLRQITSMRKQQIRRLREQGRASGSHANLMDKATTLLTARALANLHDRGETLQKHQDLVLIGKQSSAILVRSNSAGGLQAGGTSWSSNSLRWLLKTSNPEAANEDAGGISVRRSAPASGGGHAAWGPLGYPRDTYRDFPSLLPDSEDKLERITSGAELLGSKVPDTKASLKEHRARMAAMEANRRSVHSTA